MWIYDEIYRLLFLHLYLNINKCIKFRKIGKNIYQVSNSQSLKSISLYDNFSNLNTNIFKIVFISKS